MENRIEDTLETLFSHAGWDVTQEPYPGGADLMLSKGNRTYVVEVKKVSEGRPDRVIALLAQAILEAQAYAREDGHADPLALVWVKHASKPLLDKVEDFSRKFAANTAIGVVSDEGVRHFIGEDLKSLNAEAPYVRKDLTSRSIQAYNLFSDLNQWLLKVLLAPEISPELLTSPRGEYRNATELAKAADVSLMSASRFLTGLQEEGFLESGRCLQLVRRKELLLRWQSFAMRSSPEMRMRFLFPGNLKANLQKLLSRNEGCLGLFEAAQALHIGHVQGVPPYIYVPKLSPHEMQEWKGVIPARDSEQTTLIVKQALAPKSLFRGAVIVDDMRVADALQIWLDVSAHPSRGKEQADLIYREVLSRVVGGTNDRF